MTLCTTAIKETLSYRICA